MNTFKKISKIVITVLFVIGIFLVIKNYSIMISDNIKSKNYNSIIGVYVENNTYSYMVANETYQCEARIVEKDKVKDITTIRYDVKNPKECVVVVKGSSKNTLLVITTFILGIVLMFLIKNDKKKTKK